MESLESNVAIWWIHFSSRPGFVILATDVRISGGTYVGEGKTSLYWTFKL